MLSARAFVLAIAAVGTLAFGALFVMTWTHPQVLEHGLREVARVEVERRVGAKIDALSDSRIAGFARAALAKVDGDIARREDQLRRDVPAQVARVVAELTDADCGCRRRLEGYLRDGMNADLGHLGAARDGLVEVIERTYATVAAGLLRDARIVLGTNALAFLAMGVVALVRRKGGRHLLLPATALLLAVMVTLHAYLFKQDWLHTLVYADFTGFAYIAWFGLVAGALLDVLLNRGRVSTVLLNAVLAVLGAAASAVPC